MHFHVPKPIHGWREFAGEVGIIVLGVLIALSAEELVSSIRQTSEARDARDNVVAEIEQNMDVFRRRQQIEPCIERRLDEVQQLIEAAAAPLPRPLWIGRPQVWEFYSQRWASASSGGRTSLLTADEQRAFSLFYSRFAASEQMMAIEQDAWARLRSLEVLKQLAPAAGMDMVEALEEARYADWRIKINGVQVDALARKAGYAPSDLGLQPGSLSVCVPLNTTREEALKMSGRKGVFAIEP